MRKTSYIIEGSLGRRIPIDVFTPVQSASATVVYLHGFGGFKDWGDNDELARTWTNAGYRYVRFNFSLNGTTPEYPTEFVDLEGFASNNYNHMLKDTNRVLSSLTNLNGLNASGAEPARPLVLVGHSMGGTVALLAACRLATVDAAISWAAPAACKTPWERWPAGRLEEWQRSGIQFYLNGRTRQQLPIGYQLMEDFLQHAGMYDLQRQLADCRKPLLIMHGMEDEVVPMEAAKQLASWAPCARLWLGTGDHTFGRRHPVNGLGTTAAMQAVMQASIDFIRQFKS